MADVVLSVGLPRFVSMAWVVIALNRMVELVVETEEDAVVSIAEVMVVLGVAEVEEEVLGAAVVGLVTGGGMTFPTRRVQLWARASPTKSRAQRWQREPMVLLMQRRQWPVSGWQI